MNKRILVIDDDPAIRKSFTLALEDTDHVVETVETGKIGIELQNENPFDLIFLDLRMPGMNGVEVLREIRKTDRDVPIYIITAFYKEYFEELEDAGKDGLSFEIINKPVDIDNLLTLVNDIFEEVVGGSSLNSLKEYDYLLRAYVFDKEKKSKVKLEKLQTILQEHLDSRYELEIIDLMQAPKKALQDNIFATPTLIKIFPRPVRKVIGDFTVENKMLLFLDLIEKKVA